MQNVKNIIQLPFDGRAKGAREIANMIGQALLKNHEEKVEIIFPVQWAMTPAIIAYPNDGVLACLSKDDTNYKFAGFARGGYIGVTAMRSC